MVSVGAIGGGRPRDRPHDAGHRAARRWAGLRCGEIMALTWRDVDPRKRQSCVQQSDWKGHVTTTTGGRLRHVPLTRRLAAELQAHRHLRSERVVCRPDGAPLTQKMVRNHARRAARRAQVAHVGVHVLRHPFCSHLAMRGAPARTILDLAEHQDLTTTQRYMHLSPAAIADAIRLLEAPAAAPRGDCGDAGNGGLGRGPVRREACPPSHLNDTGKCFGETDFAGE